MVATVLHSRTGGVKVIHGPNDDTFDHLAGAGVDAVRAALADAFNIPAGAVALVNGVPVPPCHRLRHGSTLEFVSARGQKAGLDPDELAILRRIEGKVDQLLNTSARPAAQRGKGGRRAETKKIADYVNELRIESVTWKGVLSACKKKWPNDQRVRNADQLRKTWWRHYGRQIPSD